MKVSTVGIPWYRPDDYNKLRKLFVDGNILHATYKEWLASAEQLEKQLKDEAHYELEL